MQMDIFIRDAEAAKKRFMQYKEKLEKKMKGGNADEDRKRGRKGVR